MWYSQNDIRLGHVIEGGKSSPVVLSWLRRMKWRQLGDTHRKSVQEPGGEIIFSAIPLGLRNSIPLELEILYWTEGLVCDWTKASYCRFTSQTHGSHPCGRVGLEFLMYGNDL